MDTVTRTVTPWRVFSSDALLNQLNGRPVEPIEMSVAIDADGIYLIPKDLVAAFTKGKFARVDAEVVPIHKATCLTEDFANEVARVLEVPYLTLSNSPDIFLVVKAGDASFVPNYLPDTQAGILTPNANGSAPPARVKTDRAGDRNDPMLAGILVSNGKFLEALQTYYNAIIDRKMNDAAPFLNTLARCNNFPAIKEDCDLMIADLAAREDIPPAIRQAMIDVKASREATDARAAALFSRRGVATVAASTTRQPIAPTVATSNSGDSLVGQTLKFVVCHGRSHRVQVGDTSYMYMALVCLDDTKMGYPDRHMLAPVDHPLANARGGTVITATIKDRVATTNPADRPTYILGSEISEIEPSTVEGKLRNVAGLLRSMDGAPSGSGVFAVLKQG